MADRIRFGVVGTGFANIVHIPAFLRHADTEVVAVSSGHRENAEKTAREFGIPRVYDDHESLIADPDVDAVAVVTPPVYHCDITLQAFAAGKHVLCEKPTAMDAREAKRMLAAQRASGKVGMIAHEFRYTAQRAWAGALVEQGYLGRPTAVHMRLFMQPLPLPRPWTWHADAAMGGGYLMALGSHFIDAVRAWFGAEFEGLNGMLSTLYPERTKPDGSVAMADADDAFFFHGRLTNGALVSMSAATGVHAGGGVAIELYGSDGTLLLDQGFSMNPKLDGQVMGAKPGDRTPSLIPMPPEFRPPDTGGDDRLPPFMLLVDRFVRAVRTGEALPPNLLDGLRHQQVIDAVRQSDRERRWVAVDATEV